uniref:Acetolactate synthase n=1 Tax=Schizocladia ischiensis TaxID=196139 RepID=A0A7S6ZPC3_9STRA|nr:ilvB [Schizocladia ischiensis]QOW07573.1 ilvB [Schizocladia ischiensis]
MFIRKKTGAFALFDSLIRNGVHSVFGYPGGAILPIYDELYFWENLNMITHYLVRHEQSAAHAADGYSRATGKVGVCFATSGPGATNLVTGIATAHLDSVPMIAITGQVTADLLGTDAFQEIDIYGITLPIVKHSYVIRRAMDILTIIPEAFYIAQNGRPGPILIDIPKNMGLAKITKYRPILQKHIDSVLGYKYNFSGIKNPYAQLKPNALKRAKQHRLFFEILEELRIARRPVLYIGGGLVGSKAHKLLTIFVRTFSIPVTTTLMGKASFNENQVFSLGMLGMHGTPYANFSITCSDLLLAVGARFDDRVTGKLEEFACKALIIHIDIDAAEQGKNRDVHFSGVGDVKLFLRQIIMRNKESNNWYKFIRTRWMDQIEDWKLRFPLVKPLTFEELMIPYFKRPRTSDEILPQELVREVARRVKKDFVTTDVGQHQMWAAQYIKVRPRHWLSSAGLGTMGYGVPAAFGAAIAMRERNFGLTWRGKLILQKRAVCITGDASFQMSLPELGTLVQYRVPVQVVIVNNKWQGMVRQWQEKLYGGRYSHSYMGGRGAPDFNILADAYEMENYHLDSHHYLYHVIYRVGRRIQTPTLYNVMVVEEENCFPMVEPSKGNVEMRLSNNVWTTMADTQLPLLKDLIKEKEVDFEEKII